MNPLLTSELTSRRNFKNAKLLIVEDNPDHGFIISKAMQECLPEVKPVWAKTKEEALCYLNQCEQEEWESPKLVLLDLYLPNRHDGWYVLEKIRAMPDALGKVPVVLLSHSNDRNDIAEAYERGCSSYLVKPIKYDDWLEYFQTLRVYWWETVTLPKVNVALF
ncbi:response regulator [Rudanella paleaurantiibacter]|uniref:response regulator n=1 Tax=Rudanella paleaurantiibacter TaxID=2614655 RepID=UPI001629185C|nr:response regulator [Rudanella paleaurantiibacter]